MSFDKGIIEIRRISKIDKESKTLFKINFLLVTEGLKEVWKTRENIDFEDGKVWTVSREGFETFRPTATLRFQAAGFAVHAIRFEHRR